MLVPFVKYNASSLRFLKDLSTCFMRRLYSASLIENLAI